MSEFIKKAEAIARSECSQCGGEGWLWAHELGIGPTSDDTKYSCEGRGGEACRIAHAIKALATTPASPDQRDAEIKALREALKPFANLLRKEFPNIERYSDESGELTPINVAMIRRAHAALALGGQDGL